MEFIMRMPLPSKPSRDSTPTATAGSPGGTSPGPYTFEPYSLKLTVSEKERNSNGFLSADLTESAGYAQNKLTLSLLFCFISFCTM
jgi:hypothetical protein